LLVALISLPFAGSSFAHIDADYTRSTLLYGRPLAELAPADTTIEIAVGVSVSVQLLAQLRTLYGNYFPNLTAAFVSGDPTPLRDILSSEMYTTYAAQVTQAHAQGWTISFWDSGQLPQTLAFSSVFPSSGPQQAVGWADSLTIIYKDRSGVILSQQDYPVVNVSFGLTNSGWRITNLDLSATVPSPSPAPSAAPSGSLASPAPASGSAPPLI
jgi:hypothetical protein